MSNENICSKQDTYQSIQLDLSIPNVIVTENKLKYDLVVNEEKNKTKKIYSNISDENEKEDLIAKSKMMKINNNEDENEVYNDPNLHSEDQK
ncbi:hypothetical protein C1645_827252 [Glomus cerebriforme]|uniref:Uncharacterized protein n=1 Tax=Glomus cerebriforme TaxID=658196 RepID=A0A397SVE7_9GLOM|nr:hypothetical protein C1645_827252 [Glomus cerebriforme]